MATIKMVGHGAKVFTTAKSEYRPQNGVLEIPEELKALAMSQGFRPQTLADVAAAAAEGLNLSPDELSRGQFLRVLKSEEGRATFGTDPKACLTCGEIVADADFAYTHAEALNHFGGFGAVLAGITVEQRAQIEAAVKSPEGQNAFASGVKLCIVCQAPVASPAEAYRHVEATGHLEGFERKPEPEVVELDLATIDGVPVEASFVEKAAVPEHDPANEHCDEIACGLPKGHEGVHRDAETGAEWPSADPAPVAAEPVAGAIVTDAAPADAPPAPPESTQTIGLPAGHPQHAADADAAARSKTHAGMEGEPIAEAVAEVAAEPVAEAAAPEAAAAEPKVGE